MKKYKCVNLKYDDWRKLKEMSFVDDDSIANLIHQLIIKEYGY